MMARMAAVARTAIGMPIPMPTFAPVERPVDAAAAVGVEAEDDVAEGTDCVLPPVDAAVEVEDEEGEAVCVRIMLTISVSVLPH